MFRKLLAPVAADHQDKTAKRYKSASHADNLARTEKARRTAAVNRVRKAYEQKMTTDSESARLGQMLCNDGREDPLSYVARLQKGFFTSDFLHVQFQEPYKNNGPLLERDRARSVCSLMKAMAQVLTEMVRGHMDVKHVLNINVIDDTSTRLRGPSSSDPTTVFTIMNSVQRVHVRREAAEGWATNGCLPHQSFNVPTPLVVLDNADATTISESAMACSLVTAGGVGELFERCGVPNDIYQGDASFRTFVFVGDSLRANDRAYAIERGRLLQKRKTEESYKRNSLLKIKCCVHQIALIRKPVVLLIPRYWTTLVRISHLFETVSFRKQMAAVLTRVICKCFVCIQSPTVDPNMPNWRRKAEFLEKTYLAKSPHRQKLLSECLRFCNGDLAQAAVIHHCRFDDNGEPCCRDAQQSLQKCLALLVRFFSQGFPCPLLYRFKHYDEAAGFIQVTSWMSIPPTADSRTFSY